MQKDRFHFLNGGGECGEIIRSVNWNQTSLGNPDYWPQSLRITLNIILSSGFPMFIFWGPELVCFYNDAYRPSLGNNGKHPKAMGCPAHEVWPEVWSFIKPLIDYVITTGNGTWNEDQLVPIYRNGALENVYWTFSYSAIRDEQNGIGGVLAVCTETTQAVSSRKKSQDSQAWLQFALESGGLGIWDFNLLTREFHTSPITRKLYGLPEDAEIDAQMETNSIHEKDRERVLDAKKEALQNGTDYHVSYTVVRPDNTEVIVESKGKTYYDDTGKASRFAGIVQDVTADIRARQQQLRLTSLVENSNDYMAMSNLENKVIYINDAGRKLVGLRPDEDISHLNTKDFYTPQNFKIILKQLRPALQTGDKWTGTIIINNIKTGEEIPCHTCAINVYDPVIRQLIARGITLKDLRPELAAQKALTESGNRLSLALKASNMGTFDWLIAEDRILWDDRCRQLFGIEDDKEITYSETFLNGLHRDDQLQTEEDVKKALDPGGNRSFLSQYRTIDPQGKLLYWVKASGQCFFDNTGRPIRLVGTVLDITSQIAAHQEIAAREARFRMLANTMTQLVWITDADGIMSYANKSSYKYTGLVKETLSIESWLTLIHPDEQSAYKELLQQAFATGEKMSHEHRIRKNTGDYCWHLTRMTAHKDEMQQVQLWVSTSTDIHLLKEHEVRKNDFFQMASHELKTPVTSLKAYAQYLHNRFKKAGDAVSSGFLSKMETQIGRLEVLITDLLDINKIEGGQMRFNETAFAFNELAEEIIEELQRTTTRKILLQKSSEPQVLGDRFRIGQVLTNLLSNAIKYSPGADRVEIKTYINAQNMICCVSDFGIGIPEEQQADVFKRFYRVSGQNTDTFPGLGLGLYISAEIIKRQKGNIWLTSTLGKGSDFCFSLPLYNP